MATKLTILCSASLFAMTAFAVPAAAQDQPTPGTTTADRRVVGRYDRRDRHPEQPAIGAGAQGECDRRHRFDRGGGYRQAAGQYGLRRAAARHRRPGRARQRRGEHGPDPRPAQRDLLPQRPRGLHRNRPRRRAAGYSGRARRRSRRLQDEHAGPDRRRRRRPHRHQAAPAVRLRSGLDHRRQRAGAVQRQARRLELDRQRGGRRPLGDFERPGMGNHARGLDQRSALSRPDRVQFRIQSVQQRRRPAARPS